MSTQAIQSQQGIPQEALLNHWQGHRRLTRRLIEAFPEDQLNTFSIGGMRTFGALVQEMLSIAGPGLKGIVSGDWSTDWGEKEQSKAELLARWDEATRQLDALWPQMPPGRLGEEMLAFGQYPGIGYDQLLYFIDNEIHHRGQGYVYLRALGVEPPSFYER